MADEIHRIRIDLMIGNYDRLASRTISKSERERRNKKKKASKASKKKNRK